MICLLCMAIFLTGAVLFNLHGFDLVNELSNLLRDLNSQKKTPLWMQMRILEILSAELADKLMQNGCKIFVEPEEIIWPDGLISRPSECDSSGKKKRKKKSPTAKDGVFGKIITEYGPKKKVSASASTSTENNVVMVRPSDDAGAGDQIAKKSKTRKQAIGGLTFNSMFI